MSIQVIDSALSGATGARYDDPLKYFRLTERFYGGNNATGTAGQLDWYRLGTNPQNMNVAHAVAGAFGIKGIRAHTATDDFTVWTQYYRNVGPIRPGLSLTIRVRPQAGAFSNDAMFAFGIQEANDIAPRVAATMDFLGFRYDTGVDTNWHLVVKDQAGGAGAESTVNLGAIDTTNWTTFRLAYTATGVDGYANGVLKGTAPLTNLDTSRTWHTGMSAYNVSASGASQRICDATLYDLIVPTGGW